MNTVKATKRPRPVKGNNTAPEQICQLMGWTADEYSWYMYENGLAYLRAYLPPVDGGLYEKFEGCRLYWNWFKKMYCEIDTDLLDGSYNWVELENMKTEYDAVHNPEKVAQERKPPRCVWEDVTGKPKARQSQRDKLTDKIQRL